FGEPSDNLDLASINGHEVVFLPRHGRSHSISPHRINYRANIYAMKLAGVSQIISISAVGSLREHIKPGDFILVDQFVDNTRNRQSTFFDGSIVAHVSMADPVCARLLSRLAHACDQENITAAKGGTYLAMQGPQFSSRAESELYRSWGMDVIGMTNMPEAKLAREAEICYATIAMSTDYDCWHSEEDDVNVNSIREVMASNTKKAQQVLRAFFSDKQDLLPCRENCNAALEHAILSDLKSQDDATLKPVYALVESYQ
ncbi:MAG: S-methyl-5'-thioadenosine phosphorylase, partial [Mariprofundaceae bacterium]